jgi:acyl carrier protein
MDNETIYKRLDDVFHSVFFDDSIHVTPETTARDVPNWDSVAHLGLIAAIEAEFSLELTIRETKSLATVGDMARLIAEKTKAH